MILHYLNERKRQNQKSLAVLVDPDKVTSDLELQRLIDQCNQLSVDYFFIGGSLLVSNILDDVIIKIRESSSIPVILFPGNNMHISKHANGILFLSLISGRNADLLIGQHVIAAPILKHSGLEILPTGYIIIGDQINTTVSYISQTLPIPSNKPEIAVSTAMAGEMLGMQIIYLDAGSGASKEVPYSMVRMVKEATDIPIIVGGGINTADKVKNAYDAGADVVVLGTIIENDPDFVGDAIRMRNQLNNLYIHQ